MKKYRREEHLQKRSCSDTVIVLWTANTERYVEVREGLNMTADELLASIQRNEHEVSVSSMNRSFNCKLQVSPSNMFAVASILEGAHYINGSPQNTLVPGVIELAKKVHTKLARNPNKDRELPQFQKT